MLYLSLDKNIIKLLSLKKSLLGQYEAQFYEKTYQTALLDPQGKPVSVDYIASAVKEAIQLSAVGKNLEKDIYLILPQSSFYFFRAEIPADIATTAVDSFIQDKARVNIPISLEEVLSDYLILGNGMQKQINFFAIQIDLVTKLKEALKLIDLKLAGILPETLAYYMLFEKTLRRDKKENIWYVAYDKTRLKGYVFDTFGLLVPQMWETVIAEGQEIEPVLKEKAQDYETKGMKLNRLVLAGEQSESVRQDTFTKSIGIWTNPLKRIIANFYQDYIKLVVASANKPFPALTYEASFGAFIFSQENKTFSFFKGGGRSVSKMGKPISFSAPNLPLKEIGIFVVSFVASFLVFLMVSKTKFSVPRLSMNEKSQPTVAPTVMPIATPTPSIKRSDLKVKVLNGSGTAGLATTVKSILKDKGYGDILTGNADNFDFTQSELQVKKSEATVSAVISVDLKDHISSFKNSTLSESSAADAVIIIGADYK